MKRITQADRKRWEMNFCMYRVMDLLEWDKGEYTWFKYECGLLYLYTLFRHDPYTMGQMERLASFWGWWKTEWYQREQEFLYEHVVMCALMHKGGPVKSKYQLRAFYRIMNNPVDLARELTPAGVVLADSYSKNFMSIVYG